jgi:hypothetical protein
MADDPAINPFNSSRVRPGAFPYIFHSGCSGEDLIERLRRNAWRGQILGNHGSGKSALLAALVPLIERAGQQVVLIELRGGQRRLPRPLGVDRSAAAPTTVVIDGCEQLSPWNRWRVKRLCRRCGWGLLATAHQSVGLPPLYHAEATPEMFRQIVAQLLGSRPLQLSESEAADCLAHHKGNLREALFDLYDRYEEALRPSSGSLTAFR